MRLPQIMVAIWPSVEWVSFIKSNDHWFPIECLLIFCAFAFLTSNFQLTWADIYFAGILDYLNYMAKTDLIEKHPNLNRVVKAVNELEQIKAWLEKRPQTDV